MPTKVRFATVTDIFALVEMGSRLHAESVYSFLPYDSERVESQVAEYVSGRGERVFLVAERNGVLIGMLAGHLDQYFFCNERVAVDVFFFVEKPHRGGTAALALIETFAAWAEERGAVELCMSVSTGIDMEKTERFYQKLGLRRMGSIHKLRLNVVSS